MARRSGGGQGEPLAVRAARERERHRAQVGAYRFLAGRGPKRSVTVVPAPLLYWQYNLASPLVIALVALAVGAWLGFLGWRDDAAAAGAEAPLALGLGVTVLVLATARFTVSGAAVSTDIAGLRQTSSFGVVPRVLVTDVVRGATPPGWPRPTPRGGWWPGRTRIVVRHRAGDGEGEHAFAVRVRDPEAFAAALGRAL